MGGGESEQEDTLPLPELTEKETRLILQVLNRDEQLRQRDQFRIM